MSLYKRGGTWWMNFWVGNIHVQRSTKCKNKRDAESIERAYRTQLAKGEVNLNEPEKMLVPTFGEAVANFLAWSATEHRTKPSTTRRYKTSTVALLEFFGTDKPIDKITPDDIEKYKSWRLKTKKKAPAQKLAKNKRATTSKGISAVSVNRELACLKKLFNEAIRTARNAAKKANQSPVLIENPVSEVKFLKEENESFSVLSEHDERLYLLAASQPLRDIAALMLDCGCRPDELYQLKKQNVNLDGGFLRIVDGKTKAARRTIPLTARASAILGKRIANAKSDYLFAGGRGCTNSEKPIVKLNNAHNGAVERAGLKKFRLYDCRHTFASRLAMKGVDLVTLAALLGHSRLAMVLRYAHASEQNKFDAIKRLEKDTVAARKSG
jgi:integrase